ncbi:Uncharacterised protein [Ralstonia mannitolilytica]|uniref:hypothetical protein n=1 Tax=Ralstonia mannitolilytica TaxID=105219 RepID=UPI000E005F1E|nr:hypothetical protein [Ralstonia mannitolilytica]SUD95205.1 Uncharacterised protein [Ralstonia mannitolilytica]
MTTSITSYEKLEEFGRVPLSEHFFMRDFLHSEIAAWHGLRNIPDHPDAAIYAGEQLCQQLLEPLQATFGRIHVRSGYRSPAVNEFGNQNKLNCASNASNYSAHIWDYPDAQGMRAKLIWHHFSRELYRGQQRRDTHALRISCMDEARVCDRSHARLGWAHAPPGLQLRTR